MRLGVTTDFMVRDADEWSAMIAANPFPDVAASASPAASSCSS